jgi:transposase
VSKKFRRASVRDAKSDKIDAARLAEIGTIERDLPAFSDTRETIAAKKVLSALWHLERTRQELSGHLQLMTETCKALGIRTNNRDTQRALVCIDRQIRAYRAQLRDMAPEEARTLAAAMPGVSHDQAAALLVGLCGKHFEDRDQLVAFVGLDVRLRQSGKWQGKQVISKRGNGYLRKILFQIGWGLKMHHPEYRRVYEGMRRRGKKYTTCVLAMARKFLRFLFAFYWKRTVRLLPTSLVFETALPSPILS